jgi:hypothetical protein
MSSEDFARNDSITVGTTSVQVSERRASPPDERKIFVYRNDSPNAADKITLSFGKNAAILSKGKILSQGQEYGEADSEGFKCWKGPLQAICATATGVLAIMER